MFGLNEIFFSTKAELNFYLQDNQSIVTALSRQVEEINKAFAASPSSNAAEHDAIRRNMISSQTHLFQQTALARWNQYQSSAKNLVGRASAHLSLAERFVTTPGLTAKLLGMFAELSSQLEVGAEGIAKRYQRFEQYTPQFKDMVRELGEEIEHDLNR